MFSLNHFCESYLNHRFVILIALIMQFLSVTMTWAQPADTLYVTTFQNEYINWADDHIQTFVFPDEDRTYSKVTLYYTLGCPGYPGDCDPWDRLGFLRVLQEDEEIEIARIITPYDITGNGGPGECTWEIDVTAYQTVLRDSVTLSLYISTWIGGNEGWLVTTTFEFIARPHLLVPYQIVNLWQNDWILYGDPDDPQEDHLQPITVDIDAEADSVVLRAIATGHGQGNTDNAAEFSYKEHSAVVNSDLFSHYLWRDDCEDNPCSPQGGTWLYDRAGWCPGDKVTPWDLDITNSVIPGQTAVIDYNVQPYENFCRPSNPDCVDGVTCPDCDYNNLGHTHPNYALQSHLIYYRLAPLGQIGGLITDGQEPLAGVLVETIGPYHYTVLTDESGHFEIPAVLLGTYTLKASIYGHEVVTSDEFTLAGGELISIDLVLAPLPLGSLAGYILEAYTTENLPITGAEIQLIDTPVSTIYSDETGQYIFENIPIGPYTIWADHFGYLPAEVEAVVLAGETSDLDIQLIPIYSFENNDEGFVGDGEWERGVPLPSGGPDQAFHGQFCWGTDLDDTYAGPADMYLTTPEYSLGATDPPYELSFYHWYQTELVWDGGHVQVSTDHGANWELIHPFGDYPREVVVALDTLPGYTGQSDGWEFAQFDLAEYAGESVTLRFRLASWPNMTGLGWFIDHVVLQGQEDINTISIERGNPVITAPVDYRLFQNHPNPWHLSPGSGNSYTTVRFALPRSGEVKLTVYDVTGRRVKTLINKKMFPAGVHSLTWPGIDENGRTVSSGVYFYCLDAGQFSRTRRMTILK